MIRVFILVILLIVNSYGSFYEEAKKAQKNKNINKAIQLYKKAARTGDIESSFELGKIYYKKRDLTKAMRYFDIAALSGHKKAKYNKAIIYFQKRYKKHSYTKSFELFKELAAQGHPKAANKVGIHLTYGLGVDKDYKLAVKYFESSYFIGKYLPASCNLSLMYANGQGVFPNFGRARELAQEGVAKKLPMCLKVYKEFNLQKYDKDKGFKYGFYK